MYRRVAAVSPSFSIAERRLRFSGRLLGPWRLVVACFLFGAPLPLRAQTSDALFGGWRFAPQPLASRPAGLGGAYVAVADSVHAAFANPAGLTLIPAWEVNGSTLRPWAGAAGGPRVFRLAAYVSGLDPWDDTAPAEGAPGITAEVQEVGVAAAALLMPRVRLGLAAATTRLRARSEPASSPEAATLRGVSRETAWTMGLMVDLVRRPRISSPSLRLGLAYRPAIDWTVERVGPGRVPETRPVDLRRPTLVSAGLAWRHSGRWIVSTQADLIRYREVIRALDRNTAPGTSQAFRLENAVEPSFGVEWASHLKCGCGNVRVRAGVRGESPGRLRYVGADPSLARVFPGDRWRAVATLGASFVGEYFGRAIRLDVDSADLARGPHLSVGASVRF
jgi:hypothetical protein